MPSKLIRNSVITLAILWPTITWAQAPYSLADCFQAAMQRNEDVAVQQELILQAEEHYRQALGSILPNVSGSATYQRQDTSFNHSASPENSEIVLSLVQPLFRGFSEYAALRQTQDLIQVQTENRHFVGLQLFSSVAQFYYLVLAYQKDLEHIDADLGLFDQRIQDLQAWVRIGRSRPSEVLTVQTAAAQLRAQREQVSGQLAVAREALAFVTGLPADIVLDDTDPVPAAPSGFEIYLARIESRPDVRAAQRQATAARESVTIAGGGHWPKVDLAADYYLEHDGASLPGSWDALLSLNLPLFSGGVVSSKVRESESVARVSELALSRIKRAATQTLRTLYATLQADLAQVKAQEEALRLAEQNYRAELRDYKLALVTNQDVLLALVAFQDSQRAVDKARYAVKNDFQQLEAAAANRLNLISEVKP
jgi:outer membrane protein